MRTSQRILALGVFVAFGAAAGGSFFQLHLPSGQTPPPPSLLPVAHANPAEVGVQDTLEKGETISELLSRAQLAETEAQAVLDQLQQFQDPRRIRPGSVLSYRRSLETGDVRGMELRIDADRTLSMRRDGDGWKASVDEVPVRTDTVVLAGSVTSSLYAALIDGEGAGVPDAERRSVADILADRIFAWQIDFSRDLQPGDRFRILYERQVRPDGTARSGRVLSVQFRVENRDHEAYLFRAADGQEDYYGRNGESLRRSFLRAPLEFRRISSVFSNSRYHPLLKINRPHYGIDYAASQGTPIHAVGDGVVTGKRWSDSYGNVLDITHSHGYLSRYAHMNAFAAGIHVGSRVKQGEIIGYVGMTGLATGPHLHYEFHSDGKPVDPNSIKAITGDPLQHRYLSAFRDVVRTQILALDREGSGVLLADAGSRKRDGE